jgi:hypothetical protein
LVQRRRLVIAGEGNGGGGESPILLNSEIPLLSGRRRIISVIPLANTLTVSIRKVNIARN